ncbi:MAG: diaminopimelate epimerase, partial [Oceanobacter sp.]
NCGNGARCFARFVYDQHLTGKRKIKVETASGIMTLNLVDGGLVRVDMGAPILEPRQVPFAAEDFLPEYQRDIDNIGQVKLGAISMGNPHAVIRVDNIDTAPVETWGPIIESCHYFPNRVNVGFLQVINRQQAKLRVFERGVGETLACGTGACAAMVSGHLRGWFDDKVTISLPGGDLKIEWPGNGSVLMTGPAITVYEGRVNL